MSCIGKNIKKIRSVKKLNQTEFAALFELSRANIGSYEEERAEPKIDTIIKIAKHFKISVDSLIQKELTVNEIYNFDLFKNQNIHDGKNLKQVKIPFVDENLIKLYPIQNSTPSFVEKQSLITLPTSFAKPGSKAFFQNGNNMRDNGKGFSHGDILICEQAEHDKLRIGSPTVIVTKRKVVTGTLYRIDKEGLSLSFSNPNFQPAEIPLKELSESWIVYLNMSPEVACPQHNLQLLTMQGRLEDLEKRLRNI